jgi:hypothetical protein
VRNFAYVVQNIGRVLGEGDFFSVLQLKKLLGSEVTVGRSGSDSRHGPTGWISLPFLLRVQFGFLLMELARVALITVRGVKGMVHGHGAPSCQGDGRSGRVHGRGRPLWTGNVTSFLWCCYASQAGRPILDTDCVLFGLFGSTCR